MNWTPSEAGPGDRFGGRGQMGHAWPRVRSSRHTRGQGVLRDPRAVRRPARAHETALRSAFQTLLADTARGIGWTLIPELARAKGVTGWGGRPARRPYHPPRRHGPRRQQPAARLLGGQGHQRRPRRRDRQEDRQGLLAGQHDLRGHPHGGAVPGQAARCSCADLREPQQLCDLLNQFYAYTEPDIEDFEQAIDEFKQRVPELARGLADNIREAHEHNPKFQAAFDAFFDLCQTALNPNIARAAVDEMLVQHLLTERLIRNIFDNPEFTQRNVIAAEVEKVIDRPGQPGLQPRRVPAQPGPVLPGHRARRPALHDWNEKQHFLNTVYERFFQGYSVKVADTHGIVYTPQPIVDFMCASVAEVLQSEFGVSLTDKSVQILDPCTGTGNFIVNLMRRMPQRDLPRMYRAAAFRQRGHASAVLHRGPEHRARLLRADRHLRAVRGAVLRGYAGPGGEQAGRVLVHDGSEHAARRAPEESARSR